MTTRTKQCRDCGASFEPDQFAPTVFRCWPCRQSNDRLIRGAHAKVHKSLRDGSLVKQPCEVCGAIRVDAHHDDYSKPLSVRWLCPLHHRQHHAQDFRRSA